MVFKNRLGYIDYSKCVIIAVWFDCVLLICFYLVHQARKIVKKLHGVSFSQDEYKHETVYIMLSFIH